MRLPKSIHMLKKLKYGFEKSEEDTLDDLRCPQFFFSKLGVWVLNFLLLVKNGPSDGRCSMGILSPLHPNFEKKIV